MLTWRWRWRDISRMSRSFVRRSPTPLKTKPRSERKRSQLLAAARQQIDRGKLKLGEKWLADVSVVGSRAAVLLRDLDVRKSMLESAICAANAAIDRNDLAGAARELTLARQADADDARVIELTATVSEKLKAKLSDAMDAGRLDLAETLVKQLIALIGETDEVKQFSQGIEQCRSAWNFLGTGEPGKASEILKRVAMIFPSASWIEKTLNYMKQAELALGELRSGPLAMLSRMDQNRSTVCQPVRPGMQGLKTRATEGQVGSLPSHFILRVDGGELLRLSPAGGHDRADQLISAARFGVAG